MNTTLFQRHTATFHFAVLAALFGLALFYGSAVHPTALEYLEVVMIFEFWVLGFALIFVAFFFVPLALMDNVWVRRVALLIAFPFALQWASHLSGEYGIAGTLAFLWLLFVNYSGAFFEKEKLKKRGMLFTETGVRSIFYLFLVMLLAIALDLPTSLNHWHGKSAVLVMGFIYFSVSAFIEYKRYFTNFIRLMFHLDSDRYGLLPQSNVRYKDGKLKAHVIQYSSAHYWWLITLLGIFLIPFCSIFFYATGVTDSPLIITIITWLFLGPVFLLGIAFMVNGPWMAYKYFTAKPALLSFQEYELKEENQLFAEGFIPVYVEKQERKGFGLQLICYKVTPSTDEYEIAKVEKPIDEIITKNMTEITGKDGTRFQVEYQIPPIDNKEAKDGVYYVWHLQANMRDKSAQPNTANWKMAFTLPIN